jgi:hypothetical protein
MSSIRGEAMAIKKIVQQRRNQSNTDWDILHAETSADVVVYDDTETQLNAENVQEAIEALEEKISNPAEVSAANVSYNNTVYGGITQNVQQTLEQLFFLFQFVTLVIDGRFSDTNYSSAVLLDGGGAEPTQSKILNSGDSNLAYQIIDGGSPFSSH